MYYCVTGMLALAVILTAGGRWLLPRMSQIWVPAGLAYEGLLIITLLLEWSAHMCPWNARGTQLLWCLLCIGKFLYSIWHSSSFLLICLRTFKSCSCAEGTLKHFLSNTWQLAAFPCMTGLQAHWT